jgi:DNA invertase Pin-like site-specific DNA recombinase
MKVVAYVRVSSARQQEAYGPDIQRQEITRWAKQHRHEVIAWFGDVISGGSELASREGWRAASALVKDGIAGGIVVGRIDRLARDLMVQELLLRNLTDFGGVFVSTRANENEMISGESKDPSRKLVRSILGAISEYDREMVVDRLEAGRRAKAARGGYAHGALPYGWGSQHGKLVPVPIEQEALAKMHSLAEQGVPLSEIATVLTAEGYPTKRGGSWSSPTVSRILRRTKEYEASA